MNTKNHQLRKHMYHIVVMALLLASLLLSACQPKATVTESVDAAVAEATTESEPVAEVSPTDAVSEVVATEAATEAAAMPVRGGGGGPGGAASTTVAVPQYSDVPYATVSAAQKLDVYLPEGTGPFPLVIMVHGGGFMMGDKAAGDATTGVDLLLANGFAVASINYRLSAEAKAPAQIQDVKAAVRFLRANAAQYNINPEKFAAMGGSAGGSLVALLGTSCGVAALEGADLGNAKQSSCVQAVVDWFGPIDFLTMDEQFTGTSCPVNHNDASSPESQLVGQPIQDNPALSIAVNAITYITANVPPFFIQHGTADCNVPPQQSQALYDALTAVVGTETVTLTFLEGAGHGGSQFSDAANLQLVLDFLTLYLK